MGTRHDQEQKVLLALLVSHPHLSPPDIPGIATVILTMMKGPTDAPHPRATQMTTRTSLAARQAALGGQVDRSRMRIPTVTSRPEREGAPAPSSRTMSLRSRGEAPPEAPRMRMILALFLQVQSRTTNQSRALTMRVLAKALEMNPSQRAQTMRPQTEAQNMDQMIATSSVSSKTPWGWEELYNI